MIADNQKTMMAMIQANKDNDPAGLEAVVTKYKLEQNALAALTPPGPIGELTPQQVELQATIKAQTAAIDVATDVGRSVVRQGDKFSELMMKQGEVNQHQTNLQDPDYAKKMQAQYDYLGNQVIRESGQDVEEEDDEVEMEETDDFDTTSGAL